MRSLIKQDILCNLRALHNLAEKDGKGDAEEVIADPTFQVISERTVKASFPPMR
jgi:hypothetical protein